MEALVDGGGDFELAVEFGLLEDGGDYGGDVGEDEAPAEGFEFVSEFEEGAEADGGEEGDAGEFEDDEGFGAGGEGFHVAAEEAFLIEAGFTGEGADDRAVVLAEGEG